MHPKENPAAPVGSSSHRDDHCCNSAPAQPITSAAAAAAAVNGTGMAFHIATMDCAAEESEIRRALAPVPGLHGLSFQLGPRIVTIDAPSADIAQALKAIRKAGFDPQPAASAGPIARHDRPNYKGLMR